MPWHHAAGERDAARTSACFGDKVKPYEADQLPKSWLSEPAGGEPVAGEPSAAGEGPIENAAVELERGRYRRRAVGA